MQRPRELGNGNENEDFSFSDSRCSTNGRQPEGPRKISNGGGGRFEDESNSEAAKANVQQMQQQQSNKLSPFLETSAKRHSSLELKGWFGWNKKKLCLTHTNARTPTRTPTQTYTYKTYTCIHTPIHVHKHTKQTHSCKLTHIHTLF